MSEKAIRSLIFERLYLLITSPSENRTNIPKTIQFKPTIPVDLLTEMIDSYFTLYLSNINNTSATNAEFLTTIGNRRNWKEGCSICLEFSPSITMLRPCGHTICSDPCVIQLVEKKEIVTDLVGNIEILSKLSCPICRTKIKSAFRTDWIDVSSF